MYNWEDEGGKKTGRRERGREGGSETERVKITFVRLPSNMLRSAQGWFNPVFPAADPQPATCIPLSRLIPIPFNSKRTHVKGSTQSCMLLNWGHQRGWNQCKKSLSRKKTFVFHGVTLKEGEPT